MYGEWRRDAKQPKFQFFVLYYIERLGRTFCFYWNYYFQGIDRFVIKFCWTFLFIFVLWITFGRYVWGVYIFLPLYNFFYSLKRYSTSDFILSLNLKWKHIYTQIHYRERVHCPIFYKAFVSAVLWLRSTFVYISRFRH